ncbi:MAG: endonuclease III [Bacteroidetes bacterium]|nr:endonuclease III [Bacteroidota bacterium]
MTKPAQVRRGYSDRIEARFGILAARLRDLFGVPQRKKKLPDPLDLLIATVLSQNTNDVNSHRAYVSLKSRYPVFLDLAGAKPRDIEQLIKVGGIARKKSMAITGIVSEIMDRFPSFERRYLRRMDRSTLIDRLRELNGVGYKTASCVSLFALGDDDAFPVDTHVHRILNRLGITGEKTPDKTYLAVRGSIPPGMGYEIHINLIKFGRKVCTAQSPKCFECVLFDLCAWKEKTSHKREKVSSIDDRKVDFMILEEV